MTRQLIYAASAEADARAQHLAALADEAAAQAKAIRWGQAPEWANCIVRPTSYGQQNVEFYQRHVGTKPRPHQPQHGDDWRWAKRTTFGDLFFDEAGTLSTSVEAGNWSLEEWRPE